MTAVQQEITAAAGQQRHRGVRPRACCSRRPPSRCSSKDDGDRPSAGTTDRWKRFAPAGARRPRARRGPRTRRRAVRHPAARPRPPPRRRSAASRRQRARAAPPASAAGTRSTRPSTRSGAVAESYRSLRSAVQLLPSRPRGAARPVLVCRRPPRTTRPAGAQPARPAVRVGEARGEGKTTSLANLACALAESGRSVIVLDCDFRHPEAHLFLGVPAGRGLSDLLAADREVARSRPCCSPP